MKENTARRDAALAYAAKGMAVLPVWGVREGKCLCGREDCDSPGKHPMLINGVKSASKDPQLIKHWYEKWPEANIGIATGRISDMWVLDIDGMEGFESYDRCTQLLGDPGESWIAETGGGGAHRYYRYPKDGTKVKNRVGCEKHIDVRGDGGYAVAPPSVHVSGKEYTWAVDPEMNDTGEIDPSWAQFLMDAGIFVKEEGGNGSMRLPETGETPEEIPEGSRNGTLFGIASSLRGKGLYGGEIYACLREVNRVRCKPPLSDEELRGIADSAARYERGTQKETSCADEKGSAPVKKDTPHLEMMTITNDSLEDIAEPLWIWKGRLAAGLALLAGAPKIGKSWMALDLALHVAAGREYLGAGTQKGEVIYLALEDTGSRIKRRIRSLLGDAAMPDGFHCTLNAPPISQGLIPALEEQMDKINGPRLVIIDTLGRVRGQMQRQGNAYQFDTQEMAALKQLADKHGVCILLIHHKRKDAGTGADVYDAINGTAGIFGAMDTAMLLDGIRVGASMKEATLKMTGRDIESGDLALTFRNGHWEIDPARVPDMSPEDMEFYGDTVIKAVLAWCEREKSIDWQGSATDLRYKLLENGMGNVAADAVGKRLSRFRYDLFEKCGVDVQRKKSGGRIWMVNYNTKEMQLGFTALDDDEYHPELEDESA